LVVHPDGTEEIVTGLKQWCENRGLKYKSLYNVCFQKKKDYFGYVITKL